MSPPPSERRRNPDTRKAVDLLERHAARTTAGVEWMRRVTYGLVGLGVVTLVFTLLTAGAVVYVLHRFSVEDAQDERRSRASRIAALVDVCESVNTTNRGVRAYLRHRDPDGFREERMRARRAGEPQPFPLEPDCLGRASQLVSRPPPPRPSR